MIPANRKNRNQRRKQNNCPTNNIKYNQPPEVRNEPKREIKNEPKKNASNDPLNMKGRPLSDILKSQITHQINDSKKVEKPVEKNPEKEPEKVEETKAEEVKPEEVKPEEVKEKKAELKLYDNSKEEEHSMLVEWNIEELGKYDRIALYQHQRFHDTHYLQIFNVKENTGKYVFKGLVDGFYDVRLLNWNVRYENIPIVDCCLGEKVDIKVEIPKDIYPPVLKVYIPGKAITNKNDYVAIYNKTEHSNEFGKSLNVCYMNKAKFVNENETNEDAMKYVEFNLKNMIGDYTVKYFHYDSTSMLRGNVYSGITEFSVENYNKLEVEVDKENKKITVNWRIYTVEPNNSQWIGICDENNKLRHFEYVCYHKYENDSKMQGTVLIENNKFTEAFFDEKKEENTEETKEMEKTVEEEKSDENAPKTWKVKFYNKGMIFNTKIMEIPLDK